MKDLVVLVADKDIEFTLKGLFTRHSSLNIRRMNENYDIFVHPQRDPGCYKQCVDFLRPFTKEYKFALICFDHEGSGQEKKTREEIEIELEQNLRESGWQERASVILFEPELETWVWGTSPQIEKILGWEDCNPSLQTWLVQNNFLQEAEIKPIRPKEAMESALREVRKPRSSSIYQELAKNVSFKNCTDASFQKFNQVFQNWFAKD